MQSAEIELRNNREGLEKSAGGGEGRGAKLDKNSFTNCKNRPYKICNSIFEVISILNLFRNDLNYSSIASYIIRSILDTTLRF